MGFGVEARSLRGKEDRNALPFMRKTVVLPLLKRMGMLQKQRNVFRKAHNGQLAALGGGLTGQDAALFVGADREQGQAGPASRQGDVHGGIEVARKVSRPVQNG